MQRKRDFIVSAALRHESHSPGTSLSTSKQLWQLLSERLVQSWKALFLKLDKKTRKMENRT